mmetsp:Transcript_37496/g.84426  ORF Transcript_37496/g.84426 Transcript_37496/m.84426 type:complete len:217 (+) Transcript_37496:1259-1909(+)
MLGYRAPQVGQIKVHGQGGVHRRLEVAVGLTRHGGPSPPVANVTERLGRKLAEAGIGMVAAPQHRLATVDLPLGEATIVRNPPVVRVLVVVGVAVGQLADHAAGAVLPSVRRDDLAEPERQAAVRAVAGLCSRMVLFRMRHVSEDVRQLQAVLAHVSCGDGLDLIRLDRALLPLALHPPCLERHNPRVCRLRSTVANNLIAEGLSVLWPILIPRLC